MSDTRIASIFGAYAENLQVLIDARLDKFKTPFFPKFFDWGVPQVSLSYSTAVGRSRIEGAASIVASGGVAPIRSRADLDKYNGDVATIKVGRLLKENDYRNYLTLQAMNVSDEVKKQQILKLIWDDVAYVGNAINDRLDIMAAQAMSTGTVIVSSVTNPDGIITSDIDLLMPSANKRTVAVVWSDANAATMTPLTDFKNLMDAAELTGTVFEKILMPKALFRTFSNCTQVLNALKGYYRIEKGAVYEPTLDIVNTYLNANMYPVIELVDIVKAIEKDGSLTVLRPWKAENVTFVPSGKLGIIHNAIAIESVRPVTGTNYATYNKALLKKWMTQSPFAEITEGELNAFPGMEAIDSMFILKTDTAS